MDGFSRDYGNDLALRLIPLERRVAA